MTLTKFAVGLIPVLISGLLVASGTGNAEAAPAAATKPTKSVKADIDGDGRTDTVTSQFKAGRWLLTVKTAKRKTAKQTIPVYTDGDVWLDNPLWGVAPLDHRKGNEILVVLGGVDATVIRVFTWSGGTLKKAKAPVNVNRAQYNWLVTRHEWATFGFHFYTSKKKRYVRHYGLTLSGNRWRGTVTVLVSTSKGWKKVSAKKVAVKTSKLKRTYPGGFTGVKVRAAR